MILKKTIGIHEDVNFAVLIFPFPFFKRQLYFV